MYLKYTYNITKYRYDHACLLQCSIQLPIHTYAVKAYVLIIILYSLQTECSINIARSVHVRIQSCGPTIE